jgi:hypothetical protein
MAHRALRQLDLVALALALPLFAATGLPLVAWGAVSVAWIAQRAVQALLLRRVEASGNPRTAVGILSVSLMGRVWSLALVVLVVGLAHDGAGLPAAILTAVLFQIWFTTFMIQRGMEGSGNRGMERSE